MTGARNGKRPTRSLVETTGPRPRRPAVRMVEIVPPPTLPITRPFDLVLTDEPVDADTTEPQPTADRHPSS